MSSKTPRSIVLALIVVGVGCLIFFARWLYIQYYDGTVADRRMIPYKERKKIMGDLLSIVYEAGAISNTKPFLLYGTLLGQVRQNDFICYDFDIDVGVMSDEYNNLYTQLIKEVANHSEYHIKEKKLFGYRSVVIIHTETDINADVFEFISNTKTLARNVPHIYSRYVLNESQTNYPIEWVLPLREVSFKNQTVYVPNDTNKLLQVYYGKTYMTPDHTCNASCDECVKN